MKCSACRGIGSGIASIALLFGLGAAGYNTIRTGCPLGGCCGEACEAPETAVKPAAPAPTPTTPDLKTPEVATPQAQR